MILSSFLSLLSLLSLATAQQNHDIQWLIPSDGKPYDAIGVVDINNIDDDGNSVIQVGDTLTFTWTGQHNVVIHPSGNCDDTDGTYLGSTSPLQYTFEEEGVYTFACDVGAGAHCRMGQIINVTVTDMTESDEKADEEPEEESVSVNEEEDDEEDDEMVDEEEEDDQPLNDNVEYDENDVLKGYQDFFNPGEEQHALEFRIQPYKIPHKVTTYVDFQFNVPPEMFHGDLDGIVHIVHGDVVNSQPKHLHHFVMSGCTESIDPAMEGVPVSTLRQLRNCNIPLAGWAVGGALFGDIPKNAGQVFGPGLGIKALNINVHYTDGVDIDPNFDNDGEYAIATDGIRILFTPELRPKTMLNKPLINIGLPQNVALNVPPNESRYFYTKTCEIESSCKDTDDESMQQLGRSMGMPGMEDITCELAKAFCFMPTGMEGLLQMLCPVSCGMCDISEDDEYHLNAVTYHAHLAGNEMYATLLPTALNDDIVDLASRDLWMYDDQGSYPLSNSSSATSTGNNDGDEPSPFVTVRHGDKIQVTCVYNSLYRDQTTYFGLSTYDEMCITQISMIIDTPNMTNSSGDLNVALTLKSFSCVVDNQDDHDEDQHRMSGSDIWRGSLNEQEDARQIWKDHPVTQSDCTYPVGIMIDTSGISNMGDTVPTGDVYCVSASSSSDTIVRTKVDEICVGAGGGSGDSFTFDHDAPAGAYCEGGTFDDKDSNDPSIVMTTSDDGNSTSSFREMCTSGGGYYEPYTCKDAEAYLVGFESMFMFTEETENMRTVWWQPKCCINDAAAVVITNDVEQDEDVKSSMDDNDDMSSINKSVTTDGVTSGTFHPNSSPLIFVLVSLVLISVSEYLLFDF